MHRYACLPHMTCATQQAHNIHIHLSQQQGPSSADYDHMLQTYRDPESLEEVPLVPGLNKLDNALRWGFIKKVYGIISFQLLLTVAVASLILFNRPVEHFVTTSGPFQITVFLLSFLGELACILIPFLKTWWSRHQKLPCFLQD